MGLEREIGTLARGKLADLVILDADPLADVMNLGKIHRVIKDGKVYVPDELMRSIAAKSGRPITSAPMSSLVTISRNESRSAATPRRRSVRRGLARPHVSSPTARPIVRSPTSRARYRTRSGRRRSARFALDDDA